MDAVDDHGCDLKAQPNESRSRRVFGQKCSSDQARVSEVESMTPLQLYNKMGGFGSFIVLDTRSEELFKIGHVPRALHTPWSDSDVNTGLSLHQLEARLSKADATVFKRRIRSHLLVYGEAERRASPEANTSPAYLKLVNLLRAEKKCSTVTILKGGFEAFAVKYPFLVCAFGLSESTSHTHRPHFPGYPSEVDEDFLYLGDHTHANNRGHLLQLGITHVLNVSNEVDNAFPDSFEYLRLTLPDDPDVDIARHFQPALEFLTKAKSAASSNRVLVHCYQGVSRSAAIVLSFLIVSRGLSLKEAFSFCKACRPQISPNIGFWKQLAAFEIATRQSDTVGQCVDLSAMELELADQKAAKEKKRQQVAESANQIAAESTRGGESDHTSTCADNAAAGVEMERENPIES
jgi:protein-tyrosine phosphatase